MSRRKALRLRPEGLFVCPAFLPTKTNLISLAPNCRAYASAADSQPSTALQHRFHPATDACPLAVRSRREQDLLSDIGPVCHWA